MNDRDFLMWLHERLEYVYKESPNVDFMHKLRAIIRATPVEQSTPNIASSSSLSELKEQLRDSAKEVKE